MKEQPDFDADKFIAETNKKNNEAKSKLIDNLIKETNKNKAEILKELKDSGYKAVSVEKKLLGQGGGSKENIVEKGLEKEVLKIWNIFDADDENNFDKIFEVKKILNKYPELNFIAQKIINDQIKDINNAEKPPEEMKKLFSKLKALKIIKDFFN